MDLTQNLYISLHLPYCTPIRHPVLYAHTKDAVFLVTHRKRKGYLHMNATDQQCHELAERARQACVTLDKIAPHTDGRCAVIRGWIAPAQACLRNVPALANRIIALRAAELAAADAAREGQR